MEQPDRISVSWHVGDVLSRRPALNEDQAQVILQTVLRNYDANKGITWDIVLETADRLFPFAMLPAAEK